MSVIGYKELYKMSREIGDGIVMPYKLRQGQIAMRNLIIFILLIVASGCGSAYEVTDEFYGSYDDPQFGMFNTTLQYNGDIEPGPTADQVARTASLTIHGWLEKALPGSDRIESVLPCLQNSRVRVATVDTYFDFCPVDSIACNKNNSNDGIYLNDGTGYSCRANYIIGHEFLHDIVRCLGIPVRSPHSMPGVFVWKDEGPREWDSDSAENWISNQPGAACAAYIE